MSRLARGRRPAAIDALQRDLKANPQDSVAVARLVQLMAGPGAERSAGQPRGPRGGPEVRARQSPSATRKARSCWPRGSASTRPAQFELALPFSEKAATMLDNPVAHLNLGDLLLSMAESQADPARARPIFERAVQEYDRVLKLQPAQVEAVNNKAWVLHAYLGRSQQALELAQGLMKRVNPSSLPGEFYDTLGAIQEALGRRSDAEQSYQSGLNKSPDHPVLNYHYGKMLAADRNRTGAGQGLSGQGPGREGAAPRRHGPRRRGAHQAAQRDDLGELSRPGAESRHHRPRGALRGCSTGQPRFVTVTLVLSCRSDWIRANAAGRRRRLSDHLTGDLGTMPLGRFMTSITVLSLVALGLGACLSINAVAGQGEGQNPVVVLDTSAGRDHAGALPRQGPDHGRELPQVRGRGLLRQPDLPSGHPGIHDPGRRDDRQMEEKPEKHPPIKNESGKGLSNERGTIAMARTNNPNSATCQFFINHGDNRRSSTMPAAATRSSARSSTAWTWWTPSPRSATTTRAGHENVPVKPIYIKSAKRKTK